MTANKNKVDSWESLSEQIHQRARENAFAHKIAAEKRECKDDLLSFTALCFTLFSLVFTCLSSLESEFVLYKLESYKNTLDKNTLDKNTLDKNTLATFDINFNVLAMISAFVALLAQSWLQKKRHDIFYEKHNMFQSSFMHICQRLRITKVNDMNEDEKRLFFQDIEYDFALLKVRAPEPSDDDFTQAQVLFKKKSNSLNVREQGDVEHSANKTFITLCSLPKTVINYTACRLKRFFNFFICRNQNDKSNEI